MSDDEDLQQHIEDLKDALREYPEPQIQGAKLNQLIANVVPELDFRQAVGIPVGPGALKKFVSDYLSDTLAHVGHNGGDVMYGIEGRSAIASAMQSAAYWKTFVSPNSQLELVFQKDSEELAVRTVSELQQDDQIISKVTIDEHDSIREDFQTGLDPDMAEKLKGLEGEKDPYGEWLGRLRQQGNHMAKRWGEFRRKSLIELFEKRLEDLKISGDVAVQCTQKLADSQFSSHLQTKQQRSTTVSTPRQVKSDKLPHLQSRSSEGLDDARKFAQSVIGLMGYEDIRAVRLPLGAVLDAMGMKR
ncbi:hypothetical protein KX928_00050 [Roseobacter sp. YSTF-M11]|uniref:Uncharacterized protein n=1 Tax=Roseobacter insulae TaxID=2859783 RepID=A0A9X1JWH7_9RHOB|nr:hypothetical protein [Roseobacter insulae]MBW4706170.1 hypothetical protein [Roseobacter insulae]